MPAVLPLQPLGGPLPQLGKTVVDLEGVVDLKALDRKGNKDIVHTYTFSIYFGGAQDFFYFMNWKKIHSSFFMNGFRIMSV